MEQLSPYPQSFLVIRIAVAVDKADLTMKPLHSFGLRQVRLHPKGVQRFLDPENGFGGRALANSERNHSVLL